MEEWKDIENFKGYQVSNLGNIRSFMDHKRSIIDKPHVMSKILNCKTGYEFVHLCSGDSYKNKYVHRLVAEAFCERALDKNEVNHIDGNKLNNRCGNLEWCSRSENIKHAYRTGLKSSDAMAKAHRIPVRIVETGEIFESIKDCSKNVGSSRSKISQCLSDKHPRSSYNGYHFEYVNTK